MIIACILWAANGTVVWLLFSALFPPTADLGLCTGPYADEGHAEHTRPTLAILTSHPNASGRILTLVRICWCRQFTCAAVCMLVAQAGLVLLY